MVFESVGPIFTFCQKKNDTINYFFKLIDFGSFFCEEHISEHISKKHTLYTPTPPPTILYYTQDVRVHWAQG